MTETLSDIETNCVEEVIERVAGDLSMIADRELEIIEVVTEVVNERPAGMGQVHISFRLSLEAEGVTQHGCLLIPLPDAVTLAGSLMMLGDDMIADSRQREGLDPSCKDAVLEVGNFIGGASDAAFRALELKSRITFEGCQGVRADVRPAMIYTEGEELVVGRATVAMAGFGECQFLLMIPRAACV